MIDGIVLKRVEYLPRELEAGVLYVSDEYGVAGHLCACGCGEKVITPLGPVEWSLNAENGRPTLRPSIGNWQLPCRSHYIICKGQIVWAKAWTDAQVIAGRKAEKARRETYYASRAPNWWRRTWYVVFEWLTCLFKR